MVSIRGNADVSSKYFILIVRLLAMAHDQQLMTSDGYSQVTTDDY